MEEKDRRNIDAEIKKLLKESKDMGEFSLLNVARSATPDNLEEGVREIIKPLPGYETMEKLISALEPKEVKTKNFYGLEFEVLEIENVGIVGYHCPKCDDWVKGSPYTKLRTRLPRARDDIMIGGAGFPEFVPAYQCQHCGYTKPGVLRITLPVEEDQ